MLRLGVGHWIEPSNANNFPDGVACPVVGIGICAQHTAEICLKPELVGRLALLASFVDAVALYGSGEGRMHAHVDSRERIVAAGASQQPERLESSDIHIPVCAFQGLAGGGGSEFLVCKGVDVGSQASGRRGIHASHMVVDACLQNSIVRITVREHQERMEN